MNVIKLKWTYNIIRNVHHSLKFGCNHGEEGSVYTDLNPPVYTDLNVVKVNNCRKCTVSIQIWLDTDELLILFCDFASKGLWFITLVHTDLNIYKHLNMQIARYTVMSIQFWTLCTGTSFNHVVCLYWFENAQQDLAQSFRWVYTDINRCNVSDADVSILILTVVLIVVPIQIWTLCTGTSFNHVDS